MKMTRTTTTGTSGSRQSAVWIVRFRATHWFERTQWSPSRWAASDPAWLTRKRLDSHKCSRAASDPAYRSKGTRSHTWQRWLFSRGRSWRVPRSAAWVPRVGRSPRSLYWNKTLKKARALNWKLITKQLSKRKTSRSLHWLRPLRIWRLRWIILRDSSSRRSKRFKIRTMKKARPASPAPAMSTSTSSVSRHPSPRSSRSSLSTNQAKK